METWRNFLLVGKRLEMSVMALELVLQLQAARHYYTSASKETP